MLLKTKWLDQLLSRTAPKPDDTFIASYGQVDYIAGIAPTQDQPRGCLRQIHTAEGEDAFVRLDRASEVWIEIERHPLSW